MPEKPYKVGQHVYVFLDKHPLHKQKVTITEAIFGNKQTFYRVRVWSGKYECIFDHRELLDISMLRDNKAGSVVWDSPNPTID